MQGKLITVEYTLRTYWNLFSLGGICKQEMHHHHYVKDGSHVRLRHPSCVYITARRQYTALPYKRCVHFRNNRTKSYKLERVLFKTLEYFLSALFPKLWNSIELELNETKLVKLFKRKIFKNYLDSYASYICKKK